MTSRGLPPLLALEIPEPGRPATNRCGSTARVFLAHPLNEFAFLILGHGRRQLLSFEVTRHPTAEWLA